MSKNTPALMGRFQSIEQLATEFRGVLSTTDTASFTASLQVGHAMHALRDQLTDEVMRPIMALQNTKLGFLTDKTYPEHPNGYPMPVVRDVVIEATLRGLPLVGNCMNIIAGNLYVTKEGLRHLLAHMPEITDFDWDVEITASNDTSAKVRAWATWKQSGKERRYEGSIPVRINKGMGLDAILGKAERKLRARVYERITGTTLSDGEADDITIKAERVDQDPPGAKPWNAAATKSAPFPEPKAKTELPTEPGNEPETKPEVGNEPETKAEDAPKEDVDPTSPEATPARKRAPRKAAAPAPKADADAMAAATSKLCNKLSASGIREDEFLQVCAGFGMEVSSIEDLSLEQIEGVISDWPTVSQTVMANRQSRTK